MDFREELRSAKDPQIDWVTFRQKKPNFLKILAAYTYEGQTCSMKSVTSIRFRKSLIRSSRWFEERRFLRSESKRTRERTPAAFDQGPSRLHRDINIRGPALGERVELENEWKRRERRETGGILNRTMAMCDPERANSSSSSRDETLPFIYF